MTRKGWRAIFILAVKRQRSDHHRPWTDREIERWRRKGEPDMFPELKEVANRKKGHRKRGKK